LGAERFASSAWPIALLILCAPVCARSSRFQPQLRAQRAASAPRTVSAWAADQLVMLLGELRLKVALMAVLAHTALERSSAGISVSGTYDRRTGRSGPRCVRSLPAINRRAGGRLRQCSGCTHRVLAVHGRRRLRSGGAADASSQSRAGLFFLRPQLDTARHVDPKGCTAAMAAATLRCEAAREYQLRDSRRDGGGVPVARDAGAAHGSLKQDPLPAGLRAHHPRYGTPQQIQAGGSCSEQIDRSVCNRFPA